MINEIYACGYTHIDICMQVLIYLEVLMDLEFVFENG